MSSERNTKRDSAALAIALHGPDVKIEDAIEAAKATKQLLKAVGEEMGIDGVDWEIGSIQFKCDGCGLTRPDRPRSDEGWAHHDGDDFCPTCITGGEGGER